jgi:hypothetical protein
LKVPRSNIFHNHYKIRFNPHRKPSEGFSSTGASSLGASHRLKPYVLWLVVFIFPPYYYPIILKKYPINSNINSKSAAIVGGRPLVLVLTNMVAYNVPRVNIPPTINIANAIL